MVFSSLFFLFLFLPVTMLLYFLVPKKAQNAVLLIASLFFYAWGEPIYLILMLLSIAANYAFGLLLEKDREKDSPYRKLNLALAVIWNLAGLFFFKYYGLMERTFRFLPALNIALPIGISFYTFQVLSYVIDVYRGNIKAQRSLPDFALYVTMFPQLIAGPIVRYVDIEKELKERTVNLQKIGHGAESFIQGLAMKVLLANSFGRLYDAVEALGEKSVLLFWLGAIAYTFQLYFDFAGYSRMAIGLGRMFGFNFPENFDHPLTSKSVTEFWRRWHISLGTWFREYVYIPLGGNRVSALRHVFNILVVWMLTGFWHGASWNFLLWGLYYGILLLIEKYVFGKYLEKAPVLGWFFTFVITVLGFVLFSHTELTAAGSALAGMFGIGANGFAGNTFFYYLRSYGILFLIGIPAATPLLSNLDRRISAKLPILGIIGKMLLFILCIACLIYESYNPFLYFRF